MSINNHLKYFNFNFDSLPEDLLRLIEDKNSDPCDLAKGIETFNTQELMYIASSIRNEFNPNIITYSRKVFINLINLCKDSCSYCTYKKEPGSPGSVMLSPGQVLSIAEAGKKLRCTEALIVTGERPELKYPEARKWLNDMGYKSLAEYISYLSERVLKETGLLPHTNAGSLTKKEMALLKSTNISLGMMLESSSEKLLQPGMAHEKAPSKNPKTRIKSLVSAGELRIPITTGLLIGIGEDLSDVIDSLQLIKGLNSKFGHIQEVIIQNFSPKTGTSMENIHCPSMDYFLKCIALARIILKKVNIQCPPNLNPSHYNQYIDAGINDWGGISPLTPDYVNPEFPWPSIDEVKQVSKQKGFSLRARLPLYPSYIIEGSLYEYFLHDETKKYVDPLIDESGLLREDYLK
ncbi:MAG: 7,8-didemethyl-8-hydroxy-5-deazariboflavin synthase CofG [Thermoproteota archaeon]|nr:7,8-didemethyl-8-hydroxy-5-deazariboflavin synthase CofG [Thermoproteota archaeon]